MELAAKQLCRFVSSPDLSGTHPFPGGRATERARQIREKRWGFGGGEKPFPRGIRNHRAIGGPIDFKCARGQRGNRADWHGGCSPAPGALRMRPPCRAVIGRASIDLFRLGPALRLLTLECSRTIPASAVTGRLVAARRSKRHGFFRRGPRFFTPLQTARTVSSSFSSL